MRSLKTVRRTKLAWNVEKIDFKAARKKSRAKGVNVNAIILKFCDKKRKIVTCAKARQLTRR